MRPPEQAEWLRPDRWYRSAPGQRLILRRPLIERLSQVPLGGVAVVCGPAGSGKTMLLQSWVQAKQLGEWVAWVSLERGERDGQRLWCAVLDELARAAAPELDIKHFSPVPGFAAEVMVEQLLDELQALERPLVLVIDDLHELAAEDGLRCLKMLVARLPARMRLVLGTRVEPQLGLHRHRLAGTLIEIRGPDLSFSMQETRQLLDEAGITLSDAAVALLHERTEGWAAGLRLAAISLAGHPDPERFVSEFCGSDRTVAEYLLAEVLDRQRPETRDLLLRTSVLDRISGPLADVLTGRPGCEALIRCLEDHNAFVTALDAGRTWFRYHHLFADLLRSELRRSAPTIIGPLHRAAAEWYEEHGDIVDAIRHAQAAHDWARATRVLTLHDLDLLLDGRLATIRALLAAFPAGVRAAEPELALASAVVAIQDGAFDEADVYLNHAEGLRRNVPEERIRRFDLRLPCSRVWVACRHGDLAAVLDAMRPLQAALAEPTHQEELGLGRDVHVMALTQVGVAELWASRIADACRHLEQALALARRIRRPYFQITCLGHLAIAEALNGSRLAVTVQLADEALAIGEEQGWARHRILDAALAARGLAFVLLGRFDEAARTVERAQCALPHDRVPGLAFIVHLTRGLLHLAHGRAEDALAAFAAAEGAERLLATDHPLSLELLARQIQAHAALGDVAAARACLQDIPAPLQDRPVIRDGEAIVCLAEGRPREAIAAVRPIVDGSDEPIPLAWLRVAALLRVAVAHERLGDPRAAEAALDRALTVAAPRDIVLPFVLPPVRDFVADQVRRRTVVPPVLAAIADVLGGSTPPAEEATHAPEELSPAELRVLGYLGSPLTTGDIATELYLSPNTVRTHVRHIYAKLDAHSRGEAVARARERGLLVAR